MKFVLGCVGLCLVGVALVGHTESTVDPFDGRWKLNTAKTTQYIGDKPTAETIVIEVKGDVQHYKVDISNADGTSTKSEYTVDYNDGPWHPYMDQAAGKQSGEIMIVKVDARTQFRFIRGLDGQARGVMMRRMSEDGKTYSSTNMNLDGKLTYNRVFEKQ